MTRIAITRAISKSIARCELTHQSRVPIDLALARQQHASYESCLARLGCELIQLPEEPNLPDAVFVEDTAIVLDEVAILARPGAESRRPEIVSIAGVLKPHRTVLQIESPGTLDGGDVLVIGHDVHVGISDRTNEAAFEQLRSLLAPFEYRTHAVAVSGCLHLKSAVTAISTNTVLMNPEWVDPDPFGGHEVIEIDPGETFAANCLRIGEAVIYPTTFPRTAHRISARGISIEPIDLSELAKAEGAVTCCSLVFKHFD